MRKNEQVSVRITQEEMLRLRGLAAKEAVRLSDIVRGALAARTTTEVGLLQRLTSGLKNGPSPP